MSSINTVIPRLARILIARICIAQVFEAAKTNIHSTILYLENIKYIGSAMQIFFGNLFSSHFLI